MVYLSAKYVHAHVKVGEYTGFVCFYSVQLIIGHAHAANYYSDEFYINMCTSFGILAEKEKIL